MNENCQQAETFLNDIFKSTGLEVSETGSVTDDGCVLDHDGEDAAVLRKQGCKVFSALENLVNQSFGRALPHGQRFVCDVQDSRATREAELRAMANHAAERVRATHSAFTFGPMDPNE